MARSARKSRSALAAAAVVEAAKTDSPVEQVGFTLEEALAESGETLEELVPPPAEAPEAKVRTIGISNLALTIKNHRHRYTTVLHPNGKKTQNNGDPVAKALLNVPLAELKDIGSMWFPDAKGGGRYDHLNDGHARMCIGNLIRAGWKKGDAGIVMWVASRAPEGEDTGEEVEDESGDE